jgi:hypothetical protein
MKSAHVFKNPRRSGSKMDAPKTIYPSEESLDPAFVKEIEHRRQKVQSEKGIRFDTAEYLFTNLEK